MNLKAIIQKIASWFKSEAKTVETRIVIDAEEAEQRLKDLAASVRAAVDARIASESARISNIEATMSTPAAASVSAPATTGNNVNTAVQIALALKAIDASLSVEAVQAATNAALAAAYPAAATA
jgi:hypothetical protein